jgi:hypothetical protein
LTSAFVYSRRTAFLDFLATMTPDFWEKGF